MATGNLESTRRSDFDALRASAMLLGIVLHAALSFFPSGWMVSDRRPVPELGTLLAAIHGFRMPLFFVMCGFFAAMLLGRRGPGGLVSHRFKRVFLPLLLGLVTVVPATNWISGIAIASAKKSADASTAKSKAPSNLWQASSAGDLAAVERFLGEGAKIDAADELAGGAPLVWAAAAGRTEVVELLLRRGAAVDVPSRDGGTALHAAAFLGHDATVAALLKGGANVNAVNERGSTPLDLAKIDEGTTRYFASMLDLEVAPDRLTGRKADIAKLLAERGGKPGESQPGGAEFLLRMPLFNHLWFLWFLWWLSLGFAALAFLGRLAPGLKFPARLVLSPLRYLWLIPLTMIPQAFMGLETPLSFGPDTSVSLLPAPAVFGYYAIFFGFGALYFAADDREGRVGRAWPFELAVALFALLPLGLALAGGWPDRPDLGIDAKTRRALSILVQAAYPWIMTFGLMGLFRRYFSGGNATIRYLSDSAYWMYLVHLPLVVAVQYLVRDWPIPGLAKFALVVVATTLILLVMYRLFVRHTWIGRFLNGPRVPVQAKAATVAVAA